MVGPSGSTADGYLITVFEDGQNRPHVVGSVDGCPDVNRRESGMAKHTSVAEATKM